MYERIIAAAVIISSVIGSVPGAEFEQDGHRIWIPDYLKDGKIRGVIVHRDYGAGAKLYAKENWRKYAGEIRFAQAMLVPSAGSKKKDPVGRSQAAAAKAGRAELKNAPFVVLGVSRGGANGIALAYAAPGRAIAAVGFHGESVIGSDRVMRPDRELPVLYCMASNDPKRNWKIEPYVKKVMRQKLGAPWTLYLSKGCRHNSTGDDAFTQAWLSAVIKIRLNDDGRMKKVQWDKSFGGVFELEGAQTQNAVFKNPGIGPRPKRNAPVCWLPDKETAELWLKNLKP